MSEMIERVAQALFLAEHPDAEWTAGRARMKWFALAEEAVRAMREPTDAMKAAAERAGDPIWSSDENDVAIWQSMIDAALNDG